jgi:hypothetical protein
MYHGLSWTTHPSLASEITMEIPDNYKDAVSFMAFAFVFLVGCLTIGKWVGMGISQLILHSMGA